MGAIKFDAARMREVYNRLEEIESQIKSSCNASSEALNEIAQCFFLPTGGIFKDISENQQNEEKIAGNNNSVVLILDQFRNKTDEMQKYIQNNINMLREYLDNQIMRYTMTEQQADETLKTIDAMIGEI